jgi:UDP-2-acetamido-3-amino-2,3-dideoxy-glucuronate N-acetyltransferase
VAPRGFSAHPTALVESDRIGSGTRIWALAHVLKGAVIGRNCNVGDHCYIEDGVRIGDEVVLKNGVSLWAGVTIEDRVFIGPSVAFTNDLIPRARVYREEHGRTLVREGASLGANATLLCSITVGRFALVGAGAVVTRDVPDFGLVVGNPARLRGFVCRCGQRLSFVSEQATCGCRCRYRRAGQQVEQIG